MKIFLAGAADITPYAKAAKEIIHEQRAVIGALTGSYEVPFHWLDALPAGGPAQDHIFKNSKFERLDLFVMVVWHRAGKELSTVNPFTGENYSGNSELELATALGRHQDTGEPRVLLYRSVAPFPDDLDTEQYERVKKLFKKIDDKNLALYHRVSGVPQFKLAFRQHLLEVVLEPHAGQVEQVLSRYVEENHGSPRTLDGIILDECRRLISYLREIKQGKITDLDTTSLYNIILESFTQFESVDILDQDISRWSELVDEIGRVTVTINYSARLHEAAIARASDSSFRMRRVFVLRREELKKKRVNKILEKMASDYRPFGGRIDVRALIVHNGRVANSALAAAERNRVGRLCLELKDFVLVRNVSKPESFVLVEEFDFQARLMSQQSRSHIYAESVNTDRYAVGFEEIFEAATPIGCLCGGEA